MYKGEGRPDDNSSCRYVGTDNGGRGIDGGIGDGRAGSTMCGDGVRYLVSMSRLIDARSCFARDAQVCVSRSFVAGIVCRRELGVETAREAGGRLRNDDMDGFVVMAGTSMERSLWGRSLGILSPVSFVSLKEGVADGSSSDWRAACVPSDTARRPRSGSEGAAR